MGDLDDISCKTCLHLKIVVLKTSCCVTNSVKKNKTKSSHSASKKLISVQVFLRIEVVTLCSLRKLKKSRSCISCSVLTVLSDAILGGGCLEEECNCFKKC